MRIVGVVVSLSSCDFRLTSQDDAAPLGVVSRDAAQLSRWTVSSAQAIASTLQGSANVLAFPRVFLVCSVVFLSLTLQASLTASRGLTPVAEHDGGHHRSVAGSSLGLAGHSPMAQKALEWYSCCQDKQDTHTQGTPTQTKTDNFHHTTSIGLVMFQPA